MKYKYGFIGCGNMGSALIAAISKSLTPNCVAVCDQSNDKANNISQKFGFDVLNVQDIASNCEYIVIGVKPQALNTLFGQIGIILRERKKSGLKFTIVTMAAGISIQKITDIAECKMPVIRIMPNTPCAVGSGMILYCSSTECEKDDVETFVSDMKFAGQFDLVDESKIDAGSAISGCGPAFVYMFAQALADGGVRCGLPRDKALMYACRLLEGSAQMLIQSGKHPEQLRDDVLSPAGTTIEGVAVLEKEAFRSAVSEAVYAEYKRTEELGKQ